MVSAFYDRFPYPANPIQDGPPPGYNWRWSHADAYSSCTGLLPPQRPSLRILDAGCGTGVSTDYLAHLEMGEVIGADSSATSSIKDAQAGALWWQQARAGAVSISMTPAPVVPRRWTVLDRISGVGETVVKGTHHGGGGIRGVGAWSQQPEIWRSVSLSSLAHRPYQGCKHLFMPPATPASSAVT